jgi:hypothetical protein
MNGPAKDHLYDLLPAVYRMADARQGKPLRALLRVIEEEMNGLEGDIEGLYDDWFIETCADWVNAVYIWRMEPAQLRCQCTGLSQAQRNSRRSG